MWAALVDSGSRGVFFLHLREGVLQWKQPSNFDGALPTEKL